MGGNSGFVVGPLLVAGATCVAGLHGTAVFLLLALCTASFLFVQMRGWQQGMPEAGRPPDRPNRATTGMPSAC